MNHLSDHQNQNTRPLNNQSKTLLIIASSLMALGVLLGAFGSHRLQAFASDKAIMWWTTATLYLFIHTLGVFLVAILAKLSLASPRPAYALLLGILLFCGSLYAMALGLPTTLGMITPIGGMAFVVGWVWLLISISRH